MSARIRWTGLDELRRDLRQLPAELTDEAGGIVLDAAQSAAADVKANYASHRHTGNLGDHVSVQKQQAGQFGASAVVKSNAKHAYLFEHGTQARHTSSGSSRGTMWSRHPPAHAFIPPMIRARRNMYKLLKDLLVSHGLKVSGDA